MKAAHSLIAALPVLCLSWASSSARAQAVVDSETAPALPPIVSLRDTMSMPLSAMISKTDWGLEDLSRLRFIQLSLIRARSGDRLAVYRLSELAAAAASGHAVGLEPDIDGNTFVIADFTSGNRNRLDGFFGTFSQPPSTADARLARPPDGPRALRLSFTKHREAFCGAWIHLFDFRLTPEKRRYLDVRRFSTLSFWIRGETGGERVLLKLADAEWERREDALAVGEVADFLPAGRVEPRWRRVEVPLDRLPDRLDPSALASVVFEGLSPGAARIYVSRLAFSLATGPLPELPAQIEPVLPPRSREKATWIWNTAELLADAVKRERSLEFLERQGFTRVFLQIPTPDGDPHPVSGLDIDRGQLQPLVVALRRRGLRVYALDGYAGYALPEYHEGVLRTIDQVVAYNRRVPAEARFDGVRHDIEPYLLPGFQGPRRDSILRWTLELTAESARRARDAGLAYGADIPFWYDEPDEHLYEPVEVEFRGDRKPVSHHLIDLADDVAIMDYRTVAYGADGTIRHAAGELAYGQERGKQVFIALETSRLPDEVLFEARGRPEIGEPSLAVKGDQLALEVVGDSVRVSLIRHGYTYEEAMPAKEASAGTAVYLWPVHRRTAVPAAKLTFADLGVGELRAVMESTAGEYAGLGSFAGFALHHAESYQALLEADSTAASRP